MAIRTSFTGVFPPWAGRLGFVVLTLAASSTLLRAQLPRSELVAVKAWRGWFRATGHQGPGDLPAFIHALGKVDESYHASFTAEVYLDTYDDMPSTWTGRIVNSMLTSNFDTVLAAKTVTIESNFQAAGPPPLEATDNPPRLVFHVNGHWELHFDNNRVPTTVYQKQTFHPSGYKTNDSQTSMVYVPHNIELPYPSKGLILRGHKKFTLASVTSSGLPPFSHPVEFDVEAYLEPANLQELKLEIDAPNGYETWRPTTTPDQAAGTPLNVTARLVAADGSKPQARVESFTWKLVDTSREPGVALNFPLNASDHEFDLKLHAQGDDVRVSDDKQQVDRAVKADVTTDTVTVLPYDWGAWSTLQVTAKLADGREIIGKLKGANEPDLRLPKRSATSFIGDDWKQQHGAAGSDRSDDDGTPDGDGTKGDGFTLYEEYRGFYVNGQHLTTDPKKKDLFVRLKNAGLALGGVRQFGAMTQIEVHTDLTDTEFLPSRVMNANREAGPHLVDQHGLLVVVRAGQVGYAAARGGPGNPKQVTSIDLPDDWKGASLSYISSTVAHELGHAVNIYHHGDTDIEDVVWKLQGTELFENGQPIRIMDEAGVDLTNRAIAKIGQNPGKQRELYLGKDGGEHSGSDACIMRYDCSVTYQNRNQPIYRVMNFKEVPGATLCRTTDGTGVNAPSHAPAPRYGSASPGRGDCFHQILVSDAVEAPSRR
jgi:hypothetical protein